MKPMLSATCDDIKALTYPVLASPKLDGIRCLMIGGKAYSRNMKLIPNKFVQERLAGLGGLDGELIVGDPKAPDCYRKTNSGVMSVDGEPKFMFYVFDVWDHTEGLWFEDRLKLAKTMCATGEGKKHPHCMMVPHVKKRTWEELHEYEAQHIIAGYEGIMVRSPDGPYKEGRATLREGYLSKIKRFTDGEYRVVGIEEQMRNDNVLQKDELGRAKRTSHKENKHGKGTMGALNGVDTQTGVEFDVGTGFTDDERQDIWDNWPRDKGTIRKYKSLAVGVKEKPRHPVDLGQRLDI